jgi:hypothetical protein
VSTGDAALSTPEKKTTMFSSRTIFKAIETVWWWVDFVRGLGYWWAWCWASTEEVLGCDGPGKFPSFSHFKLSIFCFYFLF